MTPTVARHWTFLSNHAHVLVCLARDPDTRLRDVAVEVGITERAVQGIVRDLEAAGIIVRERLGRRNSYRMRLDVPLRHPLEAHCSVRALLSMVIDPTQLKRVRSA
jgi:DNA-binding Lrp family transcriptional regulator